MHWKDILGDLPALALRTAILYGAVLLVMRWTGKRTVAAMAPFDLALVIMISEVSAIPIAELNLGLLHGLAPALILGTLHVLLTTLNLRSHRMESLTEGRPTLLIANGQILMDHLRRERVSLHDLAAALRIHQVARLDEVEEAWLEPTGGVSVILRPECRPLTARDLQSKALRAELQALLALAGDPPSDGDAAGPGARGRPGAGAPDHRDQAPQGLAPGMAPYLPAAEGRAPAPAAPGDTGQEPRGRKPSPP